MLYLYIFGTIIFTVYGQIIFKWRVNHFGDLPGGEHENVTFLLRLIIDPLIFSGFLSALVASLFWMAAMTKSDISYAYPFMSLSFVLVLIIASIVLGKSITISKIVGLSLIIYSAPTI
ncbi:EamA family transporter [bacterium]|nr:EamA family transporter [bacterium]